VAVTGLSDEDTLVWADGEQVWRQLTLPGGERGLKERYYVVWVEERYTNTPQWHRRVYLLRYYTEYYTIAP